MTDRHKPYSEMIDYFECMLLPPVTDTTLIMRLSPEQMDELTNYINDPQTASSVHEDRKGRPANEIITSELIYYWMVALKIPFEAQHWHVNRLMMLIRIANFKSQPPSNRTVGETMADWRKLNAQRKEQYGTTG